jgi:GNAT superfamily N-acetyltransferase
MNPAIRDFEDRDREWARALLTERWGSARVVSRATLHRADRLPGFVAELGGDRKGLITYRIADDACEIVTLDSVDERRGIGTALLDAVRELVRSRGCRRLWLITTNDNVHAQEFYQKRGFEIVAIHENAVVESRKMKPEIPEKGFDGIPVRDEIELELKLT